MPQVRVGGTIEELKIKENQREEIYRALSGESDSRAMRFFVYESSRFTAPKLMMIQTTHTELYVRLGRLPPSGLEEFARSLVVAVEQWTPRGGHEILVDFRWAGDKRKCLRVFHTQWVDKATICHLLDLSFI